ncbi:MAG: peptidylprolyl isomerase, partial [Proteobacteria bacterium]|nr:peptidylprolyl isomerase [Pseudomonadota bacterium]
NPTEDQEEGVLLIAEDIMRMGQGKDFATLAHQYAQDLPGAKGGDLGYFKKGELVPAIDRTAFRLRV